MALSDKTKHIMCKCSFYSPNVLYNVEFGRTNPHTCKTSSNFFKKGRCILTSSLSSSPAIVRKASILAHLSRRLIGELIGYSWSVRRPSVVVNNFKHLLLQNRLPDQSQILCGASLGRGNESLFAASGSNDQDGRHAHIW